MVYISNYPGIYLTIFTNNSYLVLLTMAPRNMQVLVWNTRPYTLYRARFALLDISPGHLCSKGSILAACAFPCYGESTFVKSSKGV